MSIQDKIGYLRSDRQRFTIPNGVTGVNVERLDMGRPYAFFVIRIEDCSGFTGTLSLKVGNDTDVAQTLADLYEINDPSTKWTKTPPTTGAIQFILSHAFGTRFLQFVCSSNTDAEVNIDVWGYDPAVN